LVNWWSTWSAAQPISVFTQASEASSCKRRNTPIVLDSTVDRPGYPCKLIVMTELLSVGNLPEKTCRADLVIPGTESGGRHPDETRWNAQAMPRAAAAGIFGSTIDGRGSPNIEAPLVRVVP